MYRIINCVKVSSFSLIGQASFSINLDHLNKGIATGYKAGALQPLLPVHRYDIIQIAGNYVVACGGKAAPPDTPMPHDMLEGDMDECDREDRLCSSKEDQLSSSRAEPRPGIEVEGSETPPVDRPIGAGLNPKQLRLLLELASGRGRQEAAAATGYAPDTVSSLLHQNPDFKYAYERLVKKIQGAFVREEATKQNADYKARMAALKGSSVGVIAQLMEGAESEQVALKAAITVLEYGEKKETEQSIVLRMPEGFDAALAEARGAGAAQPQPGRANVGTADSSEGVWDPDEVNNIGVLIGGKHGS